MKVYGIQDNFTSTDINQCKIRKEVVLKDLFQSPVKSKEGFPLTSRSFGTDSENPEAVSVQMLQRKILNTL